MDMAALTAVPPDATVMAEFPDVARGSAYTLNVSRVCPGWLVIRAGTFRSGLRLAETRLAASGVSEELN
jgi:hypothetical protein